MNEQIRTKLEPEIVALHEDNYHPGDEIKTFAFRNEMGQITQILEIGKVYWVKYNPPLETESDKQIVKACGSFGEVDGSFGLAWAKIYYLDGAEDEKNLVLGFVSGMTLTKIDA